MSSHVFKPGDIVRPFGDASPLSDDGDDTNLTGVVLCVRTAQEANDSDDWIGVQWGSKIRWPSTINATPEMQAIKNFTRWHYPKYLIHATGLHAQVMEYLNREMKS